MECAVCGKRFAVDEIEAHLPGCLLAAGGKEGAEQCGEESFVVAAKWKGQRHIVRVAASADLEYLESAIRDKWFDWDHLSAFVIGDAEYAWNEEDASMRGVPTMKGTRVGDALSGVDRFKYEYDFGSTKRVYLAASPVPAAAVAMKRGLEQVAERVDEE